MSRPAGVALVLAIAALAALALLSAGLLAAAVQRGAAGGAVADALRARLAAESGAAAVVASWPSESTLELAVGQRLPTPVSGELPAGAGFSAQVERLSGGLFLVESEGRAGPAGVAARAWSGFLVRALDPGDLAARFPAAISSAGGADAGPTAELHALYPADPPPPWLSAHCPPVDPAPAPALLLPDSGLARVAAGARLDGDPPIAGGWLPEGEALPPLSWPDLAALADRVESGAVSPSPRESDGTCDRDAAANWGSPLDPDGACGGYFPLVHAPAGLHVRGGSGQGVLAVEGDLALSGGARFYGAVLVSGRIDIEHGAILYGAALALGDGSTIDGQIRFGRCAVTRGIAGSDGLSGPLRPPTRHVLPAFPPIEAAAK